MVTLPQYIEQIGDEPAARLFRVPLRTVQSWRRRERYPRQKKAQELVEVTAGRLTYEGIFGEGGNLQAAPTDQARAA